MSHPKITRACHPTRPPWICGIAVACFLSVRIAAQEKAEDLPALADRYGEVMVQHWLAEDLVRQLERAAFYHTDVASPARLRQQIDRAETQLNEARKLYAALYKKESNEPVSRLAAMLDAATAKVSENAAAAKDLLQKAGAQVNGQSFQAMPVTDADLAPAWNTNQIVHPGYGVRRILFGSTGSAGDNRTLPLRFDFGSGLYSFCIPMSGPGKLAIPEENAKRTSGAYGWMQANHSGFHYWAGVYNNQNTYVAPWFLTQHAKDPDIWMRLADGKVLAGGEWGQMNIWNPDVRAYLQDYCAAQGRTFRNDPFLVCYDYTAEPHPWGSQPPGQPQYSGYNDSAVAAFRQWLQQKFGTIEKLNTAWHTNYAAFDAINPPGDPYVKPRSKATPLSFEFEQFRWDSHTRLWKSLCDAYHNEDSAKPVVANASQFMSGWPLEALDAYGMQKAGAADWIDMHMNNFSPNLPEQIYLYSLCRLTGKMPVQFEYIWTFPRTGPVDDKSESDFRATCLGSVWRNLAWGKKAMVFFDFYYDWPAYHNGFFDSALGYSILRPSACTVPVTKRKMLRFNNLLLATEVANPPIAVIEPTSSVMNSPSLHPNQSFSFHINLMCGGVHPLLFAKNYPFLYVPEQAVLQDGYDLRQHQVLILPEAPYLPQQMTDVLLDWVKHGGTLIAFGVPGVWTPYGEDDLRLVTAVFGRSEVSDAQPGHWQWSWKVSAPRPQTKISREGESVATAVARFGKGRVLVSASNFSADPSKKLLYDEIDRAITHRPARCEKDQFELVLREDKHGKRYLFALNPHTRDIRQDEIILAGRHRHCIDLGIGSGIPVPVVVRSGETRFTLRLQPGEGTVIALQ